LVRLLDMTSSKPGIPRPKSPRGPPKIKYHPKVMSAIDNPGALTNLDPYFLRAGRIMQVEKKA